MSGSVHYRFKSSLNYDTVTFNGLHISVNDLKKAIITQKRLGTSAQFELHITNAQSNLDYKSEHELIPKNTSVIVSRIPVAGAKRPVKGWEAYKMEQTPNRPLVANEEMEGLSGVADLANAKASEEEKIQAMMIQSTRGFERHNLPTTKQLGRPYAGYICKICNQPGHFVQDCPNKDSASLDNPTKIVKRSMGIPQKFLTSADSPEQPGALLNSLGEWVVQKIDAEAYKNVKIERPPFAPEGDKRNVIKTNSIPKELQCGICHDLMVDATVTSCCGNSFCDSCIRDALLETDDFECPLCHEETNPDRLIPNKYLRTAIMNFLNETGYTKAKVLRTHNQIAAPVHQKSVDSSSNITLTRSEPSLQPVPTTVSNNKPIVTVEPTVQPSPKPDSPYRDSSPVRFDSPAPQEMKPVAETQPIQPAVNAAIKLRSVVTPDNVRAWGQPPGTEGEELIHPLHHPRIGEFPNQRLFRPIIHDPKLPLMPTPRFGTLPLPPFVNQARFPIGQPLILPPVSGSGPQAPPIAPPSRPVIAPPPGIQIPVVPPVIVRPSNPVVGSLPANPAAPPLSEEEFYREKFRLQEKVMKEKQDFDPMDDFARELMEYHRDHKNRINARKARKRSRTPTSLSRSRSRSRSASYKSRSRTPVRRSASASPRKLKRTPSPYRWSSTRRPQSPGVSPGAKRIYPRSRSRSLTKSHSSHGSPRAPRRVRTPLRAQRSRSHSRTPLTPIRKDKSLSPLVRDKPRNRTRSPDVRVSKRSRTRSPHPGLTKRRTLTRSRSRSLSRSRSRSTYHSRSRSPLDKSIKSPVRRFKSPLKLDKSQALFIDDHPGQRSWMERQNHPNYNHPYDFFQFGTRVSDDSPTAYNGPPSRMPYNPGLRPHFPPRSMGPSGMNRMTLPRHHKPLMPWAPRSLLDNAPPGIVPPPNMSPSDPRPPIVPPGVPTNMTPNPGVLPSLFDTPPYGSPQYLPPNDGFRMEEGNLRKKHEYSRSYQNDDSYRYGGERHRGRDDSRRRGSDSDKRKRYDNERSSDKPSDKKPPQKESLKSDVKTKEKPPKDKNSSSRINTKNTDKAHIDKDKVKKDKLLEKKISADSKRDDSSKKTNKKIKEVPDEKTKRDKQKKDKTSKAKNLSKESENLNAANKKIKKVSKKVTLDRQTKESSSNKPKVSTSKNVEKPKDVIKEVIAVDEKQNEIIQDVSSIGVLVKGKVGETTLITKAEKIPALDSVTFQQRKSDEERLSCRIEIVTGVGADSKPQDIDTNLDKKSVSSHSDLEQFSKEFDGGIQPVLEDKSEKAAFPIIRTESISSDALSDDKIDSKDAVDENVGDKSIEIKLHEAEPESVKHSEKLKIVKNDENKDSERTSHKVNTKESNIKKHEGPVSAAELSGKPIASNEDRADSVVVKESQTEKKVLSTKLKVKEQKPSSTQPKPNELYLDVPELSSKWEKDEDTNAAPPVKAPSTKSEKKILPKSIIESAEKAITQKVHKPISSTAVKVPSVSVPSKDNTKTRGSPSLSKKLQNKSKHSVPTTKPSKSSSSSKVSARDSPKSQSTRTVASTVSSARRQMSSSKASKPSFDKRRLGHISRSRVYEDDDYVSPDSGNEDERRVVRNSSGHVTIYKNHRHEDQKGREHRDHRRHSNYDRVSHKRSPDNRERIVKRSASPKNKKPQEADIILDRRVSLIDESAFEPDYDEYGAEDETSTSKTQDDRHSSSSFSEEPKRKKEKLDEKSKKKSKHKKHKKHKHKLKKKHKSDKDSGS